MRYIDADALYKKLYPLDLADKRKYTINAKAVADAIANIPTADVVPRSEVDDWIVTAKENLIRIEELENALKTVKADVAREIFAEIYEIMNSIHSRVQHDCVGRHGDDPHTIMLVGKLQGIKYLGDEIDELKKKYTED